MPQVDIPQDLFQQIELSLPPNGSADQFVSQAVREKLASQERREEFFRLSNATRQAMEKQGLTEQEILDDFESNRSRRLTQMEALHEFDRLCDQVSVEAGRHLTRQELHDRDCHQ